MLDDKLKQQLSSYLQLLQQPVVFTLDAGNSANGTKVRDFLNEVAALSPKLSIAEGSLKRQPSFTLDAQGAAPSGITFAGIPLGHEFESFVLALLQVSGHAPKISEKVRQQIEAIDQDLHFETFASLSCHNCPDVVQALDIMSLLNPHITHTMIEGGMFQDEAEANDIMAVPTVFLNGEEWHNGRATLEQLVNKAQGKAAVAAVNDDVSDKTYDVLIIGGGPAAGSAAIYSARKGLSTAVVADHIGGQPLETVGIENLIGTDYIEGEQLMQNIQAQMTKYNVTLIDGQTVTGLTEGSPVQVQLKGDTTLKGRTVIIATGAHWKNIGVPGEKEFRNKGVAYCPHCDGPLYKGKNVAVIGGGNSGVEAAIDLAGIAKHVSVLEFGPKIAADAVLVEKAESMANVELITNAQTTSIEGDGRVNGLVYTDRSTGDSKSLTVDGIFVQIGLVPNTGWLSECMDMDKQGQIIVNDKGATSLANVFAAGDCTNSAYKQIIISMGSGATAALGAFDALAREVSVNA
ncbi:alkyl hydroperoxide reductase subunit F [Secundilactobacillus mixtipabuli]|uniref:Alkyl hydroperoxide reductase subunit F n=1 Tax=Secundilactobacillus mixtipabuli TaxID=1435342 RepID=A0A1Z5I8Q3_9LACO|nr:alkyl hydroperoxide reductase subunit F [Secundilactobacillus mixtipabuli]GAW98134.1 alkyl hydroperoxide reductase subunit F [Secundilactobacillus mixtipabuli]